MRLAPTGDDIILPDARRQVNIPPPTRSIVPSASRARHGLFSMVTPFVDKAHLVEWQQRAC